MTKVGMPAIAGVVLLAACSGGQPAATGTSATGPVGSNVPSPSQPASSSLRSATIGVDLPLHDAQSLVRAVQMAVDDANARSGSTGWQIRIDIKDDVLAATGFADPEVGAANVRRFVDDPSVVAMVGPFNSTVAYAEIPLTNAGGLLECGPGTTNPALTKPPAALQYRSSFPDRINFVRVVAPDDDQGPAAAQYAITVLHKKRAFVIDDTMPFGQGVASAFGAEFAREGGSVVGQLGLASPTARAADPLLTSAKAKNPDVIYFGGAVVSGAAIVRQEMVKLGMAGVPFLGPDGAVDPVFIDVAGKAAANSFGTINVIGDYPAKADFTARYRAAFNDDPQPYTPGAYACTQLIMDSLEHATGPDPAALREQVRAYAVDSAHKLPTILGDLSFDANGDTKLPVISIYRVDLAAAGGKGDWVYDQQVIVATK